MIRPNPWHLPGADDCTPLTGKDRERIAALIRYVYDVHPEWRQAMFKSGSGEVHELRQLIQRARRDDVRTIRRLLHDECAFTLNLATDRLPDLVAFLLSKEGIE